MGDNTPSELGPLAAYPRSDLLMLRASERLGIHGVAEAGVAPDGIDAGLRNVSGGSAYVAPRPRKWRPLGSGPCAAPQPKRAASPPPGAMPKGAWRRSRMPRPAATNDDARSAAAMCRRATKTRSQCVCVCVTDSAQLCVTGGPAAPCPGQMRRRGVHAMFARKTVLGSDFIDAHRPLNVSGSSQHAQRPFHE